MSARHRQRYPGWVGPAVALATIVVMGSAISLRDANGSAWWLDDRFLKQGVFTAATIVVVAWEFRTNARNPKFWLVMLALFVAHVVVLGTLVALGGRWPAIWFGIIMVLECPLWFFVLWRYGFRSTLGNTIDD